MMLMSTYILWCVRALAPHALYAGALNLVFFVVFHVWIEHGAFGRVPEAVFTTDTGIRMSSADAIRDIRIRGNFMTIQDIRILS
jgi:hypothetical protein